MQCQPINFAEKLGTFSDLWSPRIVAQMNDSHFKLVKLQGEFVWHSHEHTDEVFIVLNGAMRIHFTDGSVELEPGEMVVVPRGVEHKPAATNECHVLLVEQTGTVNTGGASGSRTASDGVWI